MSSSSPLVKLSETPNTPPCCQQSRKDCSIGENHSRIGQRAVLLMVGCINEIQRYETVSKVSVGLTVVTIFLARTLKTRLEESPTAAGLLFCILASIKILLAILLFTIFVPHCSLECNAAVCPSYRPNHFYPIVVLVMGFRWVFRSGHFFELVIRSDRLSTVDRQAEAVVELKGDNVQGYSD